LLIRHSNYILLLHYNYKLYGQKYTPTDCFFGDFAHWVYGQ